jgi:3D (Asp-Asp-Asp) domain-containing protein
MIKNDIERIIFVTMIVICLIALYISGIEVDAAYNTINELQTEIALIEKHNKNLELELQDAKNLKETLSTASYIGEFEVTYYTAGIESTGKSENDPQYGITASGEPVKEDYTISADWTVLPLGTVVFIEGIGVRVVEDKGGAIKDFRIDSYEPNLETALKNGRHMAGVYVIKWGGES